MSRAQKIRIAIVEDLKEIAIELQDIFNDEIDLECDKIYHSGEEAITFLSRFPVDIVLCDIGLPGLSGIEVIRSVSKAQPSTLFCMFTVFEDNQKIFESIKAGAKGYILKNSLPDEITKSIRELYHGGSPMNPEIARKVIDVFANVPPNYQEKNNDLPLTDRENELLTHLSRGLLYKEIAVELGITTGTVKQHIHKIYDKLQVNNRTEAINKFLRR